MFSLSKRMPGIAVGVLLLSCMVGRAHASTDVLTGVSPFTDVNAMVESTYIFDSSMILNSVGFLTDNYPLTSLSYTLNNEVVTLTTDLLQSVEPNGLQWFNLLTPLTVNENSILTVRTQNTASPYTTVANVGGTNSSSNVTFAGISSNGIGPSDPGFTNSNLRVTAPGNIAPEPGSFALALTGGAALIGICILRRRNAA
jgi:hypothetical protein